MKTYSPRADHVVVIDANKILKSALNQMMSPYKHDFTLIKE